ncbi:hypothetical protein [Brevundimonas sp. NIBR11]|uniref:hypothetical protein n=1 Tax=Brevundimonas sp. NIBR11 TaxID=3015999 RepID=UPI0022F05376|nr:hypothetical protein [Brevundimonas sp. NIBR11]WGM32443.1 hypothetical protein KKHFBJBL_02695 [Brevundimonas sp. NIBR11]
MPSRFAPRLALLAAASTLTLAACGQPASEPADATAPAESTVTRTDPTPPPVPAPAALQTQAGSDGISVALTRVQVTGDVLTVQLSYSKATENSATQRFSVEEIAVIDDATSQRYGVLKDAAGRWQAAPLQAAGNDNLMIVVRNDAPTVVWFKFPAPPPTSPTVSINIPNVGPFDGVPVTR